MKYLRYSAKVALFFFIILIVEKAQALPQIEIRKIGVYTVDSISKWNSDTLVLSGRSKGINDSLDNCLLAFGKISGDFDINVSFSNNGTDQSEAGLMLREDTTSGARCIQFVNNKKGGMFIRYRLQYKAILTSVAIKGNNCVSIRILRVNDQFTFFWKMKNDMQWRTVSTVYSIPLSSTLLCGMCQSSYNTTLVTNASFFGLNGFPQQQTNCQPINWTFNTTNIDSTKLDQYTYWSLLNNYMKSSTTGGSRKSILSTVPIFALRNDSMLTFSWQIYSERDTTSEIDIYSLYGRDSVILKERMNISPGNIGSGGKLDIGIGSRVRSLFAGGNVYLRDRVYVNGNIACKGTIAQGSLDTITGTIKTNTNVFVPTIPTRTVNTGPIIKYVNPNDSIYLAPGNYKSLIIYANAKIRFSSGIYQFSRLHIESDVKFYLPTYADSTIEINVRDTLRFADRFKMILSDTTLWRNVSLYTHQSTTINLQTEMKLSGYIYIPRAKAIIYSRTLAINGGLYAKSISAEPDFSVTMKAPGEGMDILETILKNSAGTKDYRLVQKINRITVENFKDFILLSGNDTIAKGTSNKLTPCKKWLTVTGEFYKSKSFNGTGKVRILFNDGNGNIAVIDTINDDAKSFSDITMNYSTGVGSRCKPLDVDNISVSCNTSCTPIVITKQPRDTTLIVDEDARFSFMVNSTMSSSYQWYKNDAILDGETSPVLVKINVQKNDSGSYYFCKAWNVCDSAKSDTVMLSVSPCVEPVIATQPKSVLKEPGMSASFDVVATGIGLTYQWKRNNSDIYNQTERVITINNLSMENNNDELTVKVTNRCGKQILSDTAKIHIIEIAQCTISVSLHSDTLEVGDYYTGEIKASCPNSLYYWYKNGSLINQTESNQFIYGPVTMEDCGNVFTCVVSNGVRSDSTSPAVLTVIYPKKGNRLVTISGNLLDGLNMKVAENSRETHEFMVKLFSSVNGGRELYSEKFTGNKKIVVYNGEFTLQLGKGKTSQILQNVFAANSNVFAEIYAGDSSHFELTGPRLPLTTVPFAFSSGVKIVYGVGNPISTGVTAPPGALYIDQNDNNKTWKLLLSGWKKLD